MVRTKKHEPTLMSCSQLWIRQTWPGDWGKAFIPLHLVGLHLDYYVLGVVEAVERCKETGAGPLEDYENDQAVMSPAHRRLVDNLIVVCNYLKGNCKDCSLQTANQTLLDQTRRRNKWQQVFQPWLGDDVVSSPLVSRRLGKMTSRSPFQPTFPWFYRNEVKQRG